MEIAQVIWLIICGVVIIAGFWLGSYYLSEWKDACIEYAKYTAKAQMNANSKDVSKQYYADEIAKNLVQKQICLPVWSVSFILVIVFLGIVAFTLFK
jgi:hypothetical protein